MLGVFHEKRAPIKERDLLFISQTALWHKFRLLL